MHASAVAHTQTPNLTPLLRSLQHEDSDRRERAAETLGNMGDTRAVTPLIALLDDDDWFVRERVVEALGKIRDRKAVVPLTRVLQDDDWFVRERAVDALAAIADPQAAAALVEALGDVCINVQMKALQALKELGEAAVEPLIQAYLNCHPNRTKVVEALGQFADSRAVWTLVSALEDLDDEIRTTARRVLRRLGISPEDVI